MAINMLIKPFYEACVEQAVLAEEKKFFPNIPINIQLVRFVQRLEARVVNKHILYVIRFNFTEAERVDWSYNKIEDRDADWARLLNPPLSVTLDEPAALVSAAKSKWFK